MDIHQILKQLPHRYPFLLVDRVLSIEKGKSIQALKNVTINEPFFQGHFPGYPVMPGVLIVEAMAQCAGITVIHGLGEAKEGRLVYFMSIEDCRFRKPVQPGDQMRIHVQKVRSRANVWKFSGTAKVDGTLVAEATVTAMILDR